MASAREGEREEKTNAVSRECGVGERLVAKVRKDALEEVWA